MTHSPGVTERDVLGVEAPLWSETIRNLGAALFLTLPRLPAIAELGWSPSATHDWESFRTRISAHAPRWHWLQLLPGSRRALAGANSVTCARAHTTGTFFETP